MALTHRAIAVALGLAGLCTCGLAWSKDTPASDVTNGKRAYLAVGCFSCHGRSGQGGAFNYAAPPLAHTQLPVEAFKTLVRAGPNDMPAYGEAVLSDHDLVDIYTFVRSLPGPRPPKEIPLLDR
jgi:mono/diheme cytochrome c family protein